MFTELSPTWTACVCTSESTHLRQWIIWPFFFRFFIRVLLGILRACLFFCESSVGMWAVWVDLSDLVFIFKFLCYFSPFRDLQAVSEAAPDPERQTILFIWQSMYQLSSFVNICWLILEAWIFSPCVGLWFSLCTPLPSYFKADGKRRGFITPLKCCSYKPQLTVKRYFRSWRKMLFPLSLWIWQFCEFYGHYSLSQKPKELRSDHRLKGFVIFYHLLPWLVVLHSSPLWQCIWNTFWLDMPVQCSQMSEVVFFVLTPDNGAQS